VQELQQRLAVRSDYLREVDRRFRAAGVEIPFPQRDVHVKTGAAGTAPAAETERSAAGPGAEPVPEAPAAPAAPHDDRRDTR